MLLAWLNCKNQPWWAHTVMIIIADHGHKLPATGRVPDDFKIPCFGWVVRYPNTKDL